MDRKLRGRVSTQSAVRVLVVAVALLAAALLGYGGLRESNVLAESNGLDGVWIVTVSPEGQPSFTDVAAFHADGSVTVMESDARPGIGVWEKLSDHRYAFAFWVYYEEEGVFYQAKVSSTVEVTKGGEEYTGPYTVQVFVVGNPDPVFTGGGTAVGVRMHVE